MQQWSNRIWNNSESLQFTNEKWLVMLMEPREFAWDCGPGLKWKQARCNIVNDMSQGYCMQVAVILQWEREWCCGYQLWCHCEHEPNWSASVLSFSSGSLVIYIIMKLFVIFLPQENSVGGSFITWKPNQQCPLMWHCELDSLAQNK